MKIPTTRIRRGDSFITVNTADVKPDDQLWPEQDVSYQPPPDLGAYEEAQAAVDLVAQVLPSILGISSADWIKTPKLERAALIKSQVSKVVEKVSAVEDPTPKTPSKPKT